MYIHMYIHTHINHTASRGLHRRRAEPPAVVPVPPGPDHLTMLYYITIGCIIISLHYTILYISYIILCSYIF